MTGILFTRARIAGRDGVVEDGWLLTERRRIAAMGAGSPPSSPEAELVDAGGRLLMPGFIDLHVHGALGHDVMDANPDGLRTMAAFYARHGVTAFLPSTWTGSRERTLEALRAIASVCGSRPDGATILGAHMEGPYLSPQRPGAQDPALIRPATRSEALGFLDTGVVRLLGLAPEIEENRWLIGECTSRGVTVAAAHTDASYDVVVEAVRRGLRHVTHTYNAMTPLGHREPGVVGAALTLDELTCELIADGVHVHPAAMRILARLKGDRGLVLVSDAVRSCGLPEGEHQLDARRVRVVDGAVRLADGTLAGSILTLDVALHNLARATGRPALELWAAASRNAARAIGLDGTKGAIAPGLDADLVLVDEGVRVVLTVAEGRIVYRAAASMAR